MNNQSISHCFIKKSFLTIIFFFLFLTTPSHAQNSDAAKFAVYPGFGLSFGFFDPKDVNKYIENSLPTSDFQFGFSDMIMYFECHASLTFKIKWIDVTGLVEYAMAPKYITVIGYSEEDYFYCFCRLSPGILANVYFPVGSGKHAMYAGGGAQYHFMKFEEFKGNNIGYRINAGISLQLRKLNLQPFIAYNIANAKDEEDETFDLNYTGAQIGVNLSFHRPVAYR